MTVKFSTAETCWWWRVKAEINWVWWRWWLTRRSSSPPMGLAKYTAQWCKTHLKTMMLIITSSNKSQNRAQLRVKKVLTHKEELQSTNESCKISNRIMQNASKKTMMLIITWPNNLLQETKCSQVFANSRVSANSQVAMRTFPQEVSENKSIILRVVNLWWADPELQITCCCSKTQLLEQWFRVKDIERNCKYCHLREKHNKEKGTSLLLCIPLYSGKAKFPALHFRLIKQNPKLYKLHVKCQIKWESPEKSLLLFVSLLWFSCWDWE